MICEEGEMDSSVITNAVNYKGLPADRSNTGGWICNALIVGIELCERLSTLGIAVNLVPYLIGTMHLPSDMSANIVSNFMGTSFFLCLFGGFLADSCLGRYKTILIFALVQSLGTGLLAVSTALPQLKPPPCTSHYSIQSCVQPTKLQMAALYISLYLSALGTGGLKSSVSGFCTDQFDENDETDKPNLALFFNWFFFFITLGTLLAVTLLVYIQDEVGRSWGYGICSLSMFVAVLMFLSGTKRYRYRKISTTPMLHILRVLSAAMRKRNHQHLRHLCHDNPDLTRIHGTDKLRFSDEAADLTKDACESSSNLVIDPWKQMIRLLPIWATTILFWTAYSQLITFSVEQASTMNRSIWGFQIPAASLTAFFVVAILVTLGIYDPLVRPLWRKWTGKPAGFTNLQKIGIGLFLSALGMAAAAVSEAKRLSAARAAGPTTSPLPVTVFLLVPQFFLVGSGVGFMYTGQLDFFITQSPKAMKTLSTGLFLATLALGFFSSSLLVSLVKKVTAVDGGKGWVGNSVNNGRLDCFYGFLAILIFVDFGLFLVCAASYKPQLHADDIYIGT